VERSPSDQHGAPWSTRTAPACQLLTATACPQADMQEVNNSLPYDAQALPDIAATLKSGEEEPKKAQEPLPEVPKGPLTVSQAYAFLGVAEADRGQLDKVRQRGQRAPLAGAQLASRLLSARLVAQGGVHPQEERPPHRAPSQPFGCSS
jgi:hypothetical protein